MKLNDGKEIAAGLLLGMAGIFVIFKLFEFPYVFEKWVLIGCTLLSVIYGILKVIDSIQN